MAYIFSKEEIGLVGSTFYVNVLNTTDRAALSDIAVNLNFDMIGMKKKIKKEEERVLFVTSFVLGSPNFMRGVYNGSSDPLSKGSAVVQQVFNDYLNQQKISFIPTGMMTWQFPTCSDVIGNISIF